MDPNRSDVLRLAVDPRAERWPQLSWCRISARDHLPHRTAIHRRGLSLRTSVAVSLF